MIRKIVSGDTRVYDLAFTNSAGAALNITGAELWFRAKTAKTDPDASAIIAKGTLSPLTGMAIVSGSGGTATLTLLPADTTSLADNTWLYYDIQIKDSTGQVYTVESGMLWVQADIQVATS